MASSSPSEFLTFYRTIRSTSTFRYAWRQSFARPTSSRTFTTTLQQRGEDIGPDREHVLNKPAKGDHKTNVQSEQSHKGKESRAQGGADSATAQKDTSGQKDKIKKQHPEAPDSIGFQDERGGKAG